MSSPQPRPVSSHAIYATLIAVSAIGPLALNMFMPSLPGLVTDLDTTTAMAQLTLTLYLFGSAVAQLVYGPLSDRFGRRPVLLAGLGVFVATSLICALAPSIEMLVVARLLQSFGGAAGMVLSRAIIRDLHDEKAAASVLGYITMAWAIAPMIAPAIGGYLDQVAGWRASFYVLGLCGAIALTLALFTLPETNGRLADPSATNRRAAWARLLGNSRFLALTAIMSLTSGVFFAFLGGAPHIMTHELGQSPLAYGLWFTLVAIGYMTGNFLAGRFSKTAATDSLISIGLGIAVLGTAISFIAALFGSLNPFLLFFPMGLIALGNGIALPNLTSRVLSSDATAIGSAAGLAGFIQAVFGAAAAQSVGILQPANAFISIWFMAAGAAAAAIIFATSPARGEKFD